MYTKAELTATTQSHEPYSQTNVNLTTPIKRKECYVNQEENMAQVCWKKYISDYSYNKNIASEIQKGEK